MMRFPEIGDVITSPEAVALCRHFDLHELADRIAAGPERFIPWRFDGCSMLPEKLVAELVGVDSEALTQTCLKHDLKYAYGKKGDDRERLKADFELGLDLLAIGADARVSKAFFKAVQLGGGDYGLPFSWGFAHRK